ncbi:SMI1/KNR4 family protein [Acetivibrio clariflavus]|uniref:SMI1/KNR4 family protein n=1 Tax=Acetivibrio clariflavus TaxID=288965 RepID=UPI0004808B9A|nr:SMI1/KNR4 family protein [Acetivibrio clariflavus]
MSILDNVSNLYSVDVKKPPATEEEIIQLINSSPIDVPLEYLEIVREATEVEIKVKNEMYIRIWSPTSCIEMNEVYFVQKYLPKSLAIGDDEGGGALIYLHGKEGFGLYLCRFSDLDIDEAKMIAPSLADLLLNNVGIDVVMSGYV